MFEAFKRQREDDKGFTLIELLIVIIVLGILAAIVVFAVGSTRKDSVSSSCRTNYKSIELSLEAQNTKNGDYPANQADAANTAKGALLKAWPTADDYTFTYTQPAANTFQVVIAAAGGSGIAGGTLTQASTNANLKTACS